MINFETPVLLIIFNDPIKSNITFEKIRALRPKFLYISSDGPRNGIEDEMDRCLEARKIVDKIDWKCNLKTFFRDVNSGSAGKGVYMALDWFFSDVEEGIVLEYDVVPNLDFFYFCESLLVKYRSNQDVMVISGSNFQDGILRGDCSYYFSQIPTLWGFAMWRRAFQRVTFNVSEINDNKFKKVIAFKENERGVMNYWRWKLYCMKVGAISTWDYPILFSLWLNNGVSVIANRNLVTHFVDGKGYSENFTVHHPGITNVPSESILPIIYSHEIKIDREADNYLINKFNLELTIPRLIYEYLTLFWIPNILINLLRNAKILIKNKLKVGNKL